ncbi:hypothetical protein AN958_10362 [Leucoagaricus sp. SymC.cos]|nr:hypothetical protein AN958_10362 [Leucoagaricus sp. SymC.cos]
MSIDFSRSGSAVGGTGGGENSGNSAMELDDFSGLFGLELGLASAGGDSDSDRRPLRLDKWEIPLLLPPEPLPLLLQLASRIRSRYWIFNIYRTPYQ